MSAKIEQSFFLLIVKLKRQEKKKKNPGSRSRDEGNYELTQKTQGCFKSQIYCLWIRKQDHVLLHKNRGLENKKWQSTHSYKRVLEKFYSFVWGNGEGGCSLLSIWQGEILSMRLRNSRPTLSRSNANIQFIPLIFHRNSKLRN